MYPEIDDVEEGWAAWLVLALLIAFFVAGGVYARSAGFPVDAGPAGSATCTCSNVQGDR